MRISLLRFFGLFLFVCFLFISTADAATFTVNTTVDISGGCSGGNESCSLLGAMNLANSNFVDDTIVFDPAVFSSPKTITLTTTNLSISSSRNLTIIGPGSGLLTISASNIPLMLRLEDFNIVGTVSISGMTFRNAAQDAIWVGTGTLNLNDVVFRDNAGAVRNNLIYNKENAVVNISNCSFTSNSSAGSMIDNRVTMNVSNTLIAYNHSTGVVVFNLGRLDVTLSEISNHNNGRAIQNGVPENTSANLTVTHSKIFNNTRTGNGSAGTALYNFGTAAISGSHIYGNSATVESTPTSTYGGAIYNSQGTLTVNSTTISSNFVAGAGGAIYSTGGSLSLTNSTIFGNATTQIFTEYADNQGGAGLWLDDTTATITNSTIYKNSSQSDTGGLKKIGSATVTIYNSIIAGNTARTINYFGTPYNIPDAYGSFTTRGGNIVGNTTFNGGWSTGGSFNDKVDVSLAQIRIASALANNGGNAPTVALLSGGLAIGNGKLQNQTGFPTPTIDQRGAARVDANGFSRNDSGAFQYYEGLPVTNAPDLIAASDSGVSNTDNITNSRVPVLKVTGALPTAKVYLFNNNGFLGEGVADANGEVSFTDQAPPANGAVSYRAKQETSSAGSSDSTTLTVTYDTTAPTATINQAGAQPDPATVQPVNFTAAFSEPVYNLTASGVSFSGSTADLSAANVSVSGGLTNYAISVENIKTIGRILAFIPASGATDAAGNSNTAATFTDRQVSYVGNGEVVVTKTTEGGNCTAADCSLRAALNLIQDTASPASNFNVNFNIPANDTNCTAGVCTIPTSGELIVAARVAINGSGAKTLILNAGNNTSRAFYVNNSAVAAIKNLTITGGNPISGLDSSYNNNGGAILNFGSLTLDGVEVKNNRANLYNGAIGSYGNLTILNSTISNNLCSGATGSTGGIGASGTLTIVNSTISGNRIPSGTAGSAGGVWTDAQTLIVNSTVTDNETGAGGDRAGGFRHANGTSKIRNTIIAGNRSNADTPDVMGAPVSLGNNFIGNRGAVTTFNQSSDKTGTTVSVLNPLLAALGSYGGATQTHALLSNSTARDAGNDCVLIQMCGSDNVAFNLTTDQRGSLAPRKIGTSVDIGAFESNVSFSTSATGVSGQGTLPNGQINRSYSVIFAASRQNSLIEFAGDGNQTPESFTAFTYSVASGSLPPGLTLNPNTGELSGTPTQTGNFAFTILATDADGTAGAQSYNLLIMSPTAAAVSVGGRVLTSGGRGIAGAAVTITDATGNTRTTHTNFFGYYSFQDVAVGETYIFSVKAKRVFFSQPIQIRSVFEEIGDLNFIGDSPQTINFTDEIANLNFYGK